MDTRYTSRSLRHRRNTDRWECSLSHTDPVTGEMSCTYHTITGKTRKVERLLDLLDEMERHPTLKRKLAPHGGTAINLFMLDVPRLSVDIDVPYIGSVSREGMLADRPRVETGMEAVAQAQGHAVEAHPGGRAGRTFRLHYRGDLSADHAKVDRIYMNRSPILPPVMQKTLVRPGSKARTSEDAEPAAGKVKALFDRVKVRDIHDISVATVERLAPSPKIETITWANPPHEEDRCDEAVGLPANHQIR